MVDLHEGLCSNCARTVPVAACCVAHQIPICGDCYVAMNAGDGVCRVAGVLQIKPGEVRQYEQGLPLLEDGGDRVERGVIGDVPIGEMPQQEVVFFTIQRVVMNGEVKAVMRMNLATEFQCEGFGVEGDANYHAAHGSHVLTPGEMVIGGGMIDAVIDALVAVRDDKIDEMGNRIMDEELRAMTAEGREGGEGNDGTVADGSGEGNATDGGATGN